MNDRIIPEQEGLSSPANGRHYETVIAGITLSPYNPSPQYHEFIIAEADRLFNLQTALLRGRFTDILELQTGLTHLNLGFRNAKKIAATARYCGSVPTQPNAITNRDSFSSAHRRYANLFG